jgi:hypothetical protein
MTRRDDLVRRAKELAPHLINGAADDKMQEAAGFLLWEFSQSIIAQEDAAPCPNAARYDRGDCCGGDCSPMTPVIDRGMHE